MMEYAVSPTSLEQIFHTFAKEQTGAEEQGVYDNKKELALTQLLEDIVADGAAPAGTLASINGVPLRPGEGAKESSTKESTKAAGLNLTPDLSALQTETEADV
jgi:hypothetical protein